MTPEQRQRSLRSRRILLVVVGTLLVVVYVLFIGDNRVRVGLQHGVSLPWSARDFYCTGIAYPGGGVPYAHFKIDPADLPQFLTQFNENVEFPEEGPNVFGAGPWARPITPDGSLAGWSPDGTNQVWLTWNTTEDGVVVDLETDWN